MRRPSCCLPCLLQLLRQRCYRGSWRHRLQSGNGGNSGLLLLLLLLLHELLLLLLHQLLQQHRLQKHIDRGINEHPRTNG
jgi:hypothetical protein